MTARVRPCASSISHCDLSEFHVEKKVRQGTSRYVKVRRRTERNGRRKLVTVSLHAVDRV